MTGLPRIGITTSHENGKQILDIHYIRAIEAAGGLPLIVPILESDEAATQFATLLDGLVITGGPGITRGLIGHLPGDLEPVDPTRDQTDARMFTTMSEKPILGICYGMQFINAHAGGTIYADVQAQKSDALLHSNSRGGQPHPIHLEPGTRIRQLMDVPEIEVNTHHIQAILDLGEGLRATAFGPDGVVEALESHDGRLFGVQFHPERMLDKTLPLFEDFVARCQR